MDAPVCNTSLNISIKFVTAVPSAVSALDPVVICAVELPELAVTVVPRTT